MDKTSVNSIPFRSKSIRYYEYQSIARTEIILIIVLWLIQCVLLISYDVHPNPGPNNFSVRSDISICHTNIRSLKQKCKESGDRFKLSDIRCHLDKFDIITISETWLTGDDSNDDYCIQGYQKPFRRDRGVDNGPTGYGGVLAWVSDKLACKRRLDLERNDIEAMWLEVRSLNNKILVCILYRTPSNSNRDFWNKLQNMLNPVHETNAKFILLGDLNADPSTNEFEGKSLADFITANSLHSYITEPTRITDTTRSIVDHIITNSPILIKSTKVDPSISTNDHCNISAHISFKTRKPQSYSRVMWDYKNADFDKFRSELRLCDWNQCFLPEFDMDTVTKTWTECFLKIARQIIPNKIVTVRPSDKPWYTSTLRSKRREMMRLYGVAKVKNNTLNWSNYRNLRNSYFSDVREAKQAFESRKYQELSKHDKTSKQWWKLLKQVTYGGTTFSSIPPLELEGQIITDNIHKANVFNDFFVSVSNVDDTNVTTPVTNRISGNSVLTDITISETEVLDQLSILDISKSYGPDQIPPKLLREGKYEICQTLCRLFNMSLTKCTVPALWKMSNVVPIFKKGDASIVSNYRPISLLSVVNKTFERIIFKHIYHFVTDNHILNNYQSGFQHGRSTVTQLVEIYHEFCKAVDSGKEIRVVFLDIAKAFDRVWHKGLIHKLYMCGIDGRLLVWLQNYISNRYQRVVVGGQQSKWGRVTAGVPQGSVLGPLLFLLYINDIANCVQDVQVRLFADDTCIFLEVDNRVETAELINNDLARIEQWADKWIISFSAKKTKSMTISNKPDSDKNPQLIFKGEHIVGVNSYVYLGLTLSCDLRWAKHIHTLAIKARQKLNAMLPLKYKLDRHSLHTMYISFVLSSITYACVVWGGTYNSDIHKLEAIQVDAMRLITGATARSNIENLYKDTMLPPLQTLVENRMLVFMFKILKNLCPSYLTNLVSINETDGIYELRNRPSLKIPFARLESFKRSFIPFASRLWNNLSNHIRTVSSVIEFKQLLYLNEHKPNKLYYFGERFPSIHHARLRIGCSGLNDDLCTKLHVVSDSICECGFPVENAEHYFLHCPLYQHEREVLINQLQVHTDVTLEHILYGNPHLSQTINCEMFYAVHTFIVDTQRFN